ncbi:H-2 class II histocompatibility antigen, E-S beta chain-like [Rhineura floridana]|uniref:H-2 class II histocompatibility antigen, E-S beta chain-like n=1 Tax=Rhineura floridana TaxID=261503 RepID=UPI002AC8602C|nr:H-2 class II histocompatibility antigen, E-S beta chain-like [Rhineura floridana]
MMGGSCGLDLGVLLGAAVLAVLVSPPEVLGVEEPPEHFLFQKKAECHFSASSANGTLQRIRLLHRFFWDRQELLYFDSDRGRFVAVAELGERDVEAWNKDKARLRNAMADVEGFCRHNCGILAEGFSSRRKSKWGSRGRHLALLPPAQLGKGRHALHASRTLSESRRGWGDPIRLLLYDYGFDSKFRHPKRGQGKVTPAEGGHKVLHFANKKFEFQPKVKIIPTEDDSSSHNTLLICTVAGFFPPKIEIKWFRNGKEETRVWTTDVTRNGDWTFQIQVMLEAQPERGDVYACQVDHTSFEGPVTVQWEPQSDSAKSKMWTGIVGIVLGLVFVATGLTLYLKNKKGRSIPQPAVLIS